MDTFSWLTMSFLTFKISRKNIFFLILFTCLIVFISFYFRYYQCDLPPFRSYCGEAPWADIPTGDGRSRSRDRFVCLKMKRWKTQCHIQYYGIFQKWIVFCVRLNESASIGGGNWGFSGLKFDTIVESNVELTWRLKRDHTLPPQYAFQLTKLYKSL